ncbi:hypothetical protein DSECCO2_359390 [anaerobic digester metagenome]
MKGISSRTFQGILLGWAIAFEGFFALSLANTANIDGIGGIMASTFRLAAIQLILLGVFISAVWAFRMAFPDLEKPLIVRMFNILTYVAMAMVALEGVAVVLMAGDVSITGFGGVGKRWIALVGGQLFAIGVLSLRLWRLRSTTPVNWLADLLGSLAAAMLMVEGLVAIGIAGNATIQGFGTILGSTMRDAGIGLFVIGLMMFGLWWVLNDPWAGPRIGRYLNARWSLIIMVMLGGVLMAASIAASTIAGTVTVEGSSGAFKIYVVAGIAQLFGLGLMSPVLWKLSWNHLDRSGLANLISSTALAVLAFEGVFAMALAANTYIEGLGGILESTFRLAGAQLLVISAVALFAWFIKDSPLLTKWPGRIVSSTFLAATTLIALEGLAVILMAVNIRIGDFSGVGERYVLLGGVQMTLLPAIAMLCWARIGGPSTKFKLVGTGIAAFMLLMLPIAMML